MNLNQVILCGRLGKDPEMRYTPNGAAVSNFSIAVTSYIKKKEGEGYDDQTTWIDITSWGKTAERVAEYAKAGTEVIISGRIDTRSWDDKETGAKQYRTFVTAMNVQIGQGRKAADGEGSQEAPPEKPKAPDGDTTETPPSKTQASTTGEEDDDLPF